MKKTRIAVGALLIGWIVIVLLLVSKPQHEEAPQVAEAPVRTEPLATAHKALPTPQVREPELNAPVAPVDPVPVIPPAATPTRRRAVTPRVQVPQPPVNVRRRACCNKPPDTTPGETIKPCMRVLWSFKPTGEFIGMPDFNNTPITAQLYTDGQQTGYIKSVNFTGPLADVEFEVILPTDLWFGHIQKAVLILPDARRVESGTPAFAFAGIDCPL